MKTHARTFIFLALTAHAGCQPAGDNAALRMAWDQTRQQVGLAPSWNLDWTSESPAAGGSAELSLETCIEAALRNNRELRADLERIGEADADLLQASLMSNPVINFMVMFPSGGGRTMLRSSALPMQPLADLWLIPARKEVAAAELRQAILRVSDRAVETVASVKRTYVELQYAERASELIAENVELIEQTISIVQARQAAGQASQVDVNLARIRRDRMRSDLLSMRTRATTLRHELLLLMGCADASVDWTIQPLREVEPEPAEAPGEVELVLMASRQRLDLRAAEWSTEAALRRIDLSRKEGWPDLAVGFTFERAPRGRTRGASPKALAFDAITQNFAEGFNDSLGGHSTGPVAPLDMIEPIAPLPRPTREVKYTLGPMIEFELPIFDWGQAQTAKAMHAYRRALAEYDARLQDVVRTLRRTLAEHHEAREQLRLFADIILPEVEANLQLAQQAYIAGQTDLTVYLQSQEDVIATRSRMLEHLRNQRITQAGLERAVGGPVVWNGANRRPVNAPADATISPTLDDPFTFIPSVAKSNIAADVRPAERVSGSRQVAGAMQGMHGFSEVTHDGK